MGDEKFPHTPGIDAAGVVVDPAGRPSVRGRSHCHVL